MIFLGIEEGLRLRRLLGRVSYLSGRVDAQCGPRFELPEDKQKIFFDSFIFFPNKN